jgi:hypothetical protein
MNDAYKIFTQKTHPKKEGKGSKPYKVSRCSRLPMVDGIGPLRLLFDRSLQITLESRRFMDRSRKSITNHD